MTDPISLGLFRRPGAYGADVVVAEGQPLGLAAVIRRAAPGHFRRRAWRMCGACPDISSARRSIDGRRGYVLTLATREQHIRRAKATSNICTNAALCARRRRRLPRHHGQARTAPGRRAVLSTRRTTPPQKSQDWGSPSIRRRRTNRSSRNSSFTCPSPSPRSTPLREQYGIIGGYDLGRDYPHLQDHMLLAVTEIQHTPASIAWSGAAAGDAMTATSPLPMHAARREHTTRRWRLSTK